MDSKIYLHPCRVAAVKNGFALLYTLDPASTLDPNIPQPLDLLLATMYPVRDQSSGLPYSDQDSHRSGLSHDSGSVIGGHGTRSPGSTPGACHASTSDLSSTTLEQHKVCRQPTTLCTHTLRFEQQLCPAIHGRSNQMLRSCMAAWSPASNQALSCCQSAQINPISSQGLSPVSCTHKQTSRTHL